MADRERTVLVATTVHNPLDNRIFFKQVGSLIRAGWTVQYLCRRDGCPEDAHGLEVHSVNMPRHRLLRVLAGNLALFRKGLFSRASILHVHDPELFLVARLLAFRFRRVIIDLHDLPHEQLRYKPYLQDAIRKPMSRAVEWILKTVLFRATVIVAESSYIEWVGKVTRRYVLVRNFPFLRPVDEASKVVRGDSGTVTMGYVGVISRARGITSMVSALAAIESAIKKPARLKLIGAFESAALRDEVLADDRVEYLGYRPNDEAQRLLATVDVGIALTSRTPNYDHSLSTKILEYLLLRLPVIASDNPINRELFDNFPTVFLVDPASTDALVSAVLGIIRNPPDEGSRDAARECVLEEMNWQVEFARMLEVYETRS